MSEDNKITKDLTDEQKSELEKIVDKLKQGKTEQQDKANHPEKEVENQNQR
jgi:hypothetical protein